MANDLDFSFGGPFRVDLPVSEFQAETEAGARDAIQFFNVRLSDPAVLLGLTAQVFSAAVVADALSGAARLAARGRSPNQMQAYLDGYRRTALAVLARSEAFARFVADPVKGHA